MDDLKLFLRTNQHLLMALGTLGLSVTLFGVPFFSYLTAWILVPILGTIGSAVWAIFGIYDSCAQNYALRSAPTNPNDSYKVVLRRLRRNRAKAARKLYETKNYSSLRVEPQRRLAELYRLIALHTGELEEDSPKPVASRW